MKLRAISAALLVIVLTLGLSFMPARRVTIEGVGSLCLETSVTLTVGVEEVYASPALPVIDDWTVNDTGGAAVTSITLDKPTGVDVDDLLILLVGSDQGNTADWNAVSGWTQQINHNQASADANIAVYWRLATGGEGSTIEVTAGSTDERVGWYLCISGIDTSTPFNVWGTPGSGGSASSHDISGVTTDAPDCLAFWLIGVDGADTDPLTESNSGWSEIDEHNSGTTSGDVCGSWGTKNMASQGATGIVTITLEGSADGATFVQFAVNSPLDQVPPAPTVDDFIPFEFKQSDNLTPSFRFQSNDPDGTDSLHYQIQIDDDHGFGSTFFDHNSSDNPSYFSNIDTPADTPPFNENETIEYNPPSNLTDDTVWFWRVRAKEADTAYGDWNFLTGSYHWSISTDDGLSDSRWFQTADEHFETGASTNVTVSGGSASLSGVGTVTQEDLETNSGIGSTLNIPNVTVTGTNRVLYVFVTMNNNNYETTSSVTWKSGGQSFGSAIASVADDDDAQVEVFRLIAPDTGTDTIYCVFSAAVGSGVVAAVVSLSGVDQSTPNGIVATISGTANDWDLTVASGGSTEIVYAATACEYGVLSSDDPGSEIWLITQSSHQSAGGKKTGASPNVTFGWAGSGSHYAAAGMSVKPSAGGSTGTHISREIDYDWLSGATDWNQLIFNDTEGSGDIKYDIQYWNGDSWEDTSIIDIDSSPQDISALNGTTHNRIKIKAKFSVPGTPSLDDWAISWSVGVADISNAPASKDFGVVSTSTDYWSDGSAPTWPLDDGECYFTITNNGDACSITVEATNFTGGVGWTLDSSPGENIVTLKVGKSGDANEDAMVTVTTSPQAFISGLVTSIKWELKMETPTSNTDGAEKTSVMTVVATLD